MIKPLECVAIFSEELIADTHLSSLPAWVVLTSGKPKSKGVKLTALI